MYRRQLLINLLFAFTAGVLLVGCAPSSGERIATEPTTAVISAETPVATNPSPEIVTESFYNWYLETIGSREGGDLTNPLVERMFRNRAELTPGFIRQIDETLAGFENSGFDPILQAQDIPQRIEVQEATVAAESATVIVLRYWGGNPEPSPLTVHLLRENGQWRIDNITAFEIPVKEPLVEPQPPDAVVRAFYDWYLGYFGDLSQGITRNPVVDQAYHGSPYLTESFVQHVDELEESFHEMGLSGHDPFLCAQAIPTEIMPDVTFARNGMASVVMRSSFPNQRFVVDLWPDGAGWRIGNITCAAEPAGTANAFYTWYLGTIGDRSMGEMGNPLVDQAYHDHPQLTAEFIAEVDELLASFEHGGYDPFLLAQDIPQDFSVDPGVAENTAVVHLQFGADNVKHLLLTMDETGRRIAAVSEDGGLLNNAPTSGDKSADGNQAVFICDEGFSFTIPSGWEVKPLDSLAGGPDDWPVTAAWQLFPAELADQLQGSGQPDPTAPVVIAPFNIELVQGDRVDLQRVYGELEGETAVVNEHNILLVRAEPGVTRAIFAHSQRPDTWLIFTDWVTNFPGREKQGITAAPLWDPLLNSVIFH